MERNGSILIGMECNGTVLLFYILRSKHSKHWFQLEPTHSTFLRNEMVRHIEGIFPFEEPYGSISTYLCSKNQTQESSQLLEPFHSSS